MFDFLTAGFFLMAFWALGFLMILAFFSREKYISSAIAFLAVGLVFLVLPNGYGFGYLFTMDFLKLLGAYVGIGCSWCFFRWLFSLLRIRNKAKSVVTEEGWTYPLTEDQKERISKHLGAFSSYRHAKMHFPPHMSDYYDDFWVWSSLWPVDAFWFLLSVPTIHVWKWIYALTAGTLTRIRDRLFKEFL